MRQRIRRVPEAAVRAMHAELVAEHGGRAGIRDEGLFCHPRWRVPRDRRVCGASTTLFGLAAGYDVGISTQRVRGYRVASRSTEYVLTAKGHRKRRWEVYTGRFGEDVLVAGQ